MYAGGNVWKRYSEILYHIVFLETKRNCEGYQGCEHERSFFLFLQIKTWTNISVSSFDLFHTLLVCFHLYSRLFCLFGLHFCAKFLDFFAAVKKGRYSLDRRAEAILESRQYWGKPEIPQNAHIKKETGERNNASNGNSSVTLPCYSSSGSSVASQAVRSDSNSTISPQPIQQTSGEAELSTDDIFTMLSEVYGDEMTGGGGGATYGNSSTIDTASLSSLLSSTTAPNIAQNNTTTTATASSNKIRPESQFSSNNTNTSPLEQFKFNAGCSQTPGFGPYQNSTVITPQILSKTEIKQELPPTPSPSNSGYEVSPSSISAASPASVQDISSPPSSQYTSGATAVFGFQMPGTNSFPVARTDPLHHTPPVQPV